MLSQASKLLAVPALALLALASPRQAVAHVMPSASFEVSAMVVASCQVDTGRVAVTRANTRVSCNGAAAGEVGGSPVSDLSNPTDDEAAAGPNTQAVVITY